MAHHVRIILTRLLVNFMTQGMGHIRGEPHLDPVRQELSWMHDLQKFGRALKY